jgi:transposase
MPKWAIVGSMIPPARHGGRKRSVDVREILNEIYYILWTGCQWKALPKDLTWTRPWDHGTGLLIGISAAPTS